MSVRPSLLLTALVVGVIANIALETSLQAQTAAPLPSLTLDSPLIIDDGDDGFIAAGWTKTQLAAAYLGDLTYMAKSQASQRGSARWTFSDLEAGYYTIYASWPAFSFNTTSAEYVGKDGAGRMLAFATINQTKLPSTGTYGNMRWQALGIAAVADGQLNVELTIGNGYTLADAVMIQKYAKETPTASSSSSSMTPAGYCGDGARGAFEQCDDGNKKPGDACSPLCTTEQCGDRVVTPMLAEECDDGNRAPNDGCNAMCKHEFCGDNILQVGLGEQCDDGNAKRGDGCNDACKLETTTSVPSSVASSFSSASSIASVSPPPASIVCPQGYFCTKALINNQCAARAIHCGVGYTLEVSGACGTNACAGSCARCIPDGTASSQTSTSSVASSSSALSEDFCTINPGSCSSSSVSAAAPTAQLFIKQQIGGGAIVAVKNEKNIPLLQFEARAGNADVLLTKAAFAAAAGSVNNAQNYTLWVDTNLDAIVDLIVEKGVAPEGGIVSFDGFAGGGFVIPKDKTFIFEVHADIAASLTQDARLQLKFATPSNDYIAAQQRAGGGNLTGISTDDVCVAACSIGVWTANAITWNLVSQGNLFVYQDTVQRPHQLLGSALSDPILHLELRSQSEEIIVTDLQLTSRGTQALSVERLELYKADGITLFAVATVGGCGSDQVVTTDNGIAVRTFCANMDARQLVVPKNSAVDVFVRVRMKNDEQGTVSGEEIQFFIDAQPVADDAAGRGAVRARGGRSSNTLVANDGDFVAEGELFIGTAVPAANAHIVSQKNVSVLSKLVSISNANPDRDGSSIPTGVVPFGQFRFSAASHANVKNGLNRVMLQTLFFEVHMINAEFDASGFKIYNKATTPVKQNCQALQADGSTIAQGSINGRFFVRCTLENTPISATLESGTTHTFVLEANITNPRIHSQTFAQAFAMLNGINTENPALESPVRWMDMDAGGSRSYGFVDYIESAIYSTIYTH